MKNLGLITPCYAADTSGVCSMLYEMDGMTVVHDASGCNSTYTTHDEPRWTSQKSMIYISAFTELDAIMGNDEKLICDILSAAADQHPRFIAVCGSPMPMMTGVDFDAIAAEIRFRSGIPAIPLHTTGTHPYLDGAGEALCRYIAEFVPYSSRHTENGVNILGATPLDFGLTETVPDLKDWLTQAGFCPVACFAMGDQTENLSRAGEAAVNLVISQAGMEAARYMQQQFGIPYVVGLPCGAALSAALASALHEAIHTRKSAYPCAKRIAGAPSLTVIGEGVQSASIAAALSLAGTPANVVCPLPIDRAALSESDQTLSAEEDIKAYLAAHCPETVIADPLYQPLLPAGSALHPLPHFAFSGRCFAGRMRSLIHTKFEECFYD